MAIFYCDICDSYIDDDWHPCVEHKGSLICPDCAVELDEEGECEDKVTPKVPFTKGQRLIIQQLEQQDEG